jgi:hypothetical protein
VGNGPFLRHHQRREARLPLAPRRPSPRFAHVFPATEGLPGAMPGRSGAYRAFRVHYYREADFPPLLRRPRIMDSAQPLADQLALRLHVPRLAPRRCPRRQLKPAPKVLGDLHRHVIGPRKYPNRRKHASETTSDSKYSSERACAVAHDTSSSDGLIDVSSPTVIRSESRVGRALERRHRPSCPTSAVRRPTHSSSPIGRTTRLTTGGHAASLCLLSRIATSPRRSLRRSLTRRLMDFSALSWLYRAPRVGG